MNLLRCEDCGHYCSPEADACPNCGNKHPGCHAQVEQEERTKAITAISFGVVAALFFTILFAFWGIGIFWAIVFGLGGAISVGFRMYWYLKNEA